MLQEEIQRNKSRRYVLREKIITVEVCGEILVLMYGGGGGL
jgi:hypothetical protein